MENVKKMPGYLSFNDSKSELDIFALADEEIGYELAARIYYGTSRKIVEMFLYNIAKEVELDNVSEVINSDKFLIKFG